MNVRGQVITGSGGSSNGIFRREQGHERNSDLWVNIKPIFQENACKNDFYRINDCRSNTRWLQRIL